MNVGFVIGKPFGGTAFILCNTLLRCVSSIITAIELSVRSKNNVTQILLCSVYKPIDLTDIDEEYEFVSDCLKTPIVNSNANGKLCAGMSIFDGIGIDVTVFAILSLIGVFQMQTVS
jgi:hypothetical protein